MDRQRALYTALDNRDAATLARLLQEEPNPAESAQSLLDVELSAYEDKTRPEPAVELDLADASVGCLQTLLRAGADPWRVTRMHPRESIGVVAAACAHGACKKGLFHMLLAMTRPDREAEAETMGAILARGIDDHRVAAYAREARAQRWATLLPFMVSCYRFGPGSTLEELAQRVRAYAPSAQELRATNGLGMTPLHMAATWEFLSTDPAFQAARALAAHALLGFGADPLARDAEGQTPRDLVDADSPMHEVLQLAEEDVRARQRALAMALHPRLGRHSPLALLGRDLLVNFIATPANCVPHTPRRGPLLEYATELEATLAQDENVRICMEYDAGAIYNFNLYGDLQTLFGEHVLEQRELTPEMRQYFRLLWLGAFSPGAPNDRRPKVQMLAELKRRALADGRLPPLSHWR